MRLEGDWKALYMVSVILFFEYTAFSSYNDLQEISSLYVGKGKVSKGNAGICQDIYKIYDTSLRWGKLLFFIFGFVIRINGRKENAAFGPNSPNSPLRLKTNLYGAVLVSMGPKLSA